MDPQIPTIQIPGPTKAGGSGVVEIASRSDAHHSGTFKIELSVQFDPVADAYPVGSVRIDVDLSDSFKGAAVSTFLHQLTSTGKHTPTLFLSGRCDFRVTGEEERPPVGCQFWLLVANNRNRRAERTGTPDVVSFLILDRAGGQVAYGTGPLVKGDIQVN